MRTLLAAAAVLAASVTTGPVAAQEYPWCAVYPRESGTNCGFVSWTQCMQTISGIGGFCRENGFYRGAIERGRPSNERKPKRRAEDR